MSQQLFLVLTSNRMWFACFDIPQAHKLAKDLLKKCEYVKIVRFEECETLTKSEKL